MDIEHICKEMHLGQIHHKNAYKKDSLGNAKRTDL